MRFFFIASIFPLLILSGCQARVNEQSINRLSAIAIVRQHAANSQIVLDQHNLFVLEQTHMWRVILEQKGGNPTQQGVEYILYKRNGEILGVKPYLYELSSDSAQRGVEKSEAIQIAQNNAKQFLKSLDGYNIFVLEESYAWRIVFEPKHDGGGPTYIIDKQTGKILSATVSL